MNILTGKTSSTKTTEEITEISVMMFILIQIHLKQIISIIEERTEVEIEMLLMRLLMCLLMGSMMILVMSLMMRFMLRLMKLKSRIELSKEIVHIEMETRKSILI